MHFVLPSLERAQKYQDEAVQEEEQAWGTGQEYAAVDGRSGTGRRGSSGKAVAASAPQGALRLAEGAFMLRKGLLGTVCVEIDGLNGANLAGSGSSSSGGGSRGKNKEGGILWWQFSTGGDAKTLNFFVVEGDFGSTAMEVQVRNLHQFQVYQRLCSLVAACLLGLARCIVVQGTEASPAVTVRGTHGSVPEHRCVAKLGRSRMGVAVPPDLKCIRGKERYRA
jgi:hypothetical protein